MFTTHVLFICPHGYVDIYVFILFIHVFMQMLQLPSEKGFYNL